MKKAQVTNSISVNVLIVLVCIAMLLGGIAIVFSLKGREKIAYVDAIKLISKYDGMIDARKGFGGKTEMFKSNLDTLKTELDQAISNYDSAKSKASTSEKLFMEQLIASKQKQFVEYQNTAQEQYKKQEQELSTEILKKVNAYIKKYGEREGYSLILAITPYGNIAYGNDVLDITEVVLEGLNKEYKLTRSFK